MGRLQDFPTVTPTASDKLLVVQSQSQGLTTIGDFKSDKMDKANPTGTGSLSLNRSGTTGSYSVAVGRTTTASGANGSLAEGYSTTASGESSHAEGRGGTASGNQSHAEGYNTIASNNQAHAEGSGCTASGERSHAEGSSTTASGERSHSEGSVTTASGSWSHAEGSGTIASRRGQHVFGEYNVEDTTGADGTAKGSYIEIVGKGTSTTRSNARTLDWSGNEVLAGDLSMIGTTIAGATTDTDKIINALANVTFKTGTNVITIKNANGTPHLTVIMNSVDNNYGFGIAFGYYIKHIYKVNNNNRTFTITQID